MGSELLRNPQARPRITLHADDPNSKDHVLTKYGEDITANCLKTSVQVDNFSEIRFSLLSYLVSIWLHHKRTVELIQQTCWKFQFCSYPTFLKKSLLYYHCHLKRQTPTHWATIISKQLLPHREVSNHWIRILCVLKGRGERRITASYILPAMVGVSVQFAGIDLDSDSSEYIIATIDQIIKNIRLTVCSEYILWKLNKRSFGFSQNHKLDDVYRPVLVVYNSFIRFIRLTKMCVRNE